MRRSLPMRRSIRAALMLCALFLLSAGAHAQLFRTYLASYGDDANPCTVSQPCRLLPAALNAVLDHGEVWILDSANFNSGTVAVAKNVTIQAIPGQVGSIMAVASTPAMTIGTAVKVVLRNLSIATNANSPGTHGIQVTGGGDLTVESSVFAIRNNSIGIWAADANTRLAVHDTSFHSSYAGLYVLSGAMAEVSRSTFSGCQYAGVFAYSNNSSTGAKVTISDSLFSNSNMGVFAETELSGVVRASVARSTFSGNQSGLLSESFGGSVVVTAANNEISNNATGYVQSGAGAVLESTGHNTVRNNTTNTGTITTVPES